MINHENYRSFPAVSNSDLTETKKLFMSCPEIINLEKAYAEGNLIDAMITEPQRVNHFKKKLDNVQYSDDTFEMCREMKKAFMKDDFCRQLVTHKDCKFQHISYNPNFEITHNVTGNEFTFEIAAKAKWDLFISSFDMGGDIKSTACYTQKQVEEAVRYFDYDRSRAWYMDLEGRSNDILLFISKKNYRIFKVPIKRGDALFSEGKLKYQKLAFTHYSLFH